MYHRVEDFTRHNVLRRNEIPALVDAIRRRVRNARIYRGFDQPHRVAAINLLRFIANCPVADRSYRVEVMTEDLAESL